MHAVISQNFPVASSREDAWIETWEDLAQYLVDEVASSREDAWIETTLICA